MVVGPSLVSMISQATSLILQTLKVSCVSGELCSLDRPLEVSLGTQSLWNSFGLFL